MAVRKSDTELRKETGVVFGRKNIGASLSIGSNKNFLGQFLGILALV